MRGHTPLIAMRKAGFVPDWVFVETGPDVLEAWRDWPAIDNSRAQVQIEPTDRHLDVRFAVGLLCYVAGDDAKRVHQVRDALIAVKASRVIASVFERRPREGFVLVECSDTANILTTEAEIG